MSTSMEQEISQAASSAASVGTDERLAQLTSDAITAAGKDGVRAIHESIKQAMAVMNEVNESAKRLEELVLRETEAHAQKVGLAIRDFQGLIKAMKTQEGQLTRLLPNAAFGAGNAQKGLIQR